MTDKQKKEDAQYFKQCKKLQLSIVTHEKYEYFSNYLKDYEFGILKLVGNANSYSDLPNLKYIKCYYKLKKGC